MKKLLSIAVLLMMTLQFNSCDDIDILSPPGPAGLSAYKEWVNAVKDGTIPWTAGTDLPNFFKFLKGDKGEAGASAYASWVELIKTGTVENPHKPGSKWDPSKDAPSDFYSFLTGAKGDAGITPQINAKGNWQIGDKDTGIPAKGQPGVAGSVVEINDAGNWEIDGADTGISAKGKDGISGTDGESAYGIWVAEVEAGNIKDKDGNLWPAGNITLGDFWDYLSGKSSPGIMVEQTPLLLIKSGIDPDDKAYELFEFETDPEAVVTMEFENSQVVGVADGAGKCSLRFPNRKDQNIPVFVFAHVTKKQPSKTLLLTIKAQVAVFTLADEAFWYNSDGTTLIGQGSGGFPWGDYDIINSPRRITWVTNVGAKVVNIPFTVENVKSISLIGGKNTVFEASYAWDADGKGGKLIIRRPVNPVYPYVDDMLLEIQVVSLAGIVSNTPLLVNTYNSK